MSIFGDIMGKIMGSTHPAAPAEGAPAAAEAPGAAPAASPTAPVDVEAVMNDLEEKNGSHLNWKSSIVDMLKLLDMDSSLATREKLADELHYTGDKSDTATMNEWLHAEVMKQLAENGGKLPADLKA